MFRQRVSANPRADPGSAALAASACLRSLQALQQPQHRLGRLLRLLHRVEVAALDPLEVLTRQPDAMIALPGGIGTLTELSLALNLSVISANSAKPIVLLGPVWRAVLENFYIQNDGLTSQEDLARVRFCVTPEEAAEFFHNNTNRK